MLVWLLWLKTHALAPQLAVYLTMQTFLMRILAAGLCLLLDAARVENTDDRNANKIDEDSRVCIPKRCLLRFSLLFLFVLL